MTAVRHSNGRSDVWTNYSSYPGQLGIQSEMVKEAGKKNSKVETQLNNVVNQIENHHRQELQNLKLRKKSVEDSMLAYSEKMRKLSKERQLPDMGNVEDEKAPRQANLAKLFAIESGRAVSHKPKSLRGKLREQNEQIESPLEHDQAWVDASKPVIPKRLPKLKKKFRKISDEVSTSDSELLIKKNGVPRLRHSVQENSTFVTHSRQRRPGVTLRPNLDEIRRAEQFDSNSPTDSLDIASLNNEQDEETASIEELVNDKTALCQNQVNSDVGCHTKSWGSLKNIDIPSRKTDNSFVDALNTITRTTKCKKAKTREGAKQMFKCSEIFEITSSWQSSESDDDDSSIFVKENSLINELGLDIRDRARLSSRRRSVSAPVSPVLGDIQLKSVLKKNGDFGSQSLKKNVQFKFPVSIRQRTFIEDEYRCESLESRQSPNTVTIIADE